MYEGTYAFVKKYGWSNSNWFKIWFYLSFLFHFSDSLLVWAIICKSVRSVPQGAAPQCLSLYDWKIRDCRLSGQDSSEWSSSIRQLRRFLSLGIRPQAPGPLSFDFFLSCLPVRAHHLSSYRPFRAQLVRHNSGWPLAGWILQSAKILSVSCLIWICSSFSCHLTSSTGQKAELTHPRRSAASSSHQIGS